jgi:hypothetical protein
MKTVLLAALFAAALSLSGETGEAAQNRSAKEDNQYPYLSIAPPFITPAKTSFLIRETDSFVVTVTATCPLQDDGLTQFELLPSSPAFVRVSQPYRNEVRDNNYAEGLAVIEVAPQIGDAGKYIVSLRVRSCSGKVDQVVTFKVRVKPSE